mgnify:CR=1 FL=1
MLIREAEELIANVASDLIRPNKYHPVLVKGCQFSLCRRVNARVGVTTDYLRDGERCWAFIDNLKALLDVFANLLSGLTQSCCNVSAFNEDETTLLVFIVSIRSSFDRL